MMQKLAQYRNKIYLLCTLVFMLIGTSSYAQYTTLLNFEGTTNGKYPIGSLLSDGTFLYGMTPFGGSNNLGTIFKIMPDGTGYVKLSDFVGATNGEYPVGSLISDGTFLYGMTQRGGTNDYGTVFKIMPNGTGYVKLLDFAGATNGKYPIGALISDGTFLYGMTQHGGTNDIGVMFKIMPDGTGYAKLLDFAGASNGNYPKGTLVSDGTFLYGMTEYGGVNNLGTIFKIMPDGSGYVKLLDFAGTNGRYPNGSLISDGTFLYGMTWQGGTNDLGTIFKIMPNGTGYVKLLDFDCITNGCIPSGSFISDGTFLYGITYSGGANDIGTIFKIMPNGTGYVKLLDFDCTTNGCISWGSLISDGNFLYGMTEYGGTNNFGVLFKFHPPGLSIEETNLNAITIYPNPTSGIINVSTSVNGVQSVSISNILGEVVLSKELNLVAGSSFTIDISEQPAGIYLLRVGNSTERIIRE